LKPNADEWLKKTEKVFYKMCQKNFIFHLFPIWEAPCCQKSKPLYPPVLFAFLAYCTRFLAHP
jgi:hypothetical protein